MPDYGQMVLEQHGTKKVDGYPSILPPKKPPVSPEVAAMAPKPVWWYNVYVIFSGIVHLAQQRDHIYLTERGWEIWAWLEQRKARLASEDRTD